MAEGHGHPLVVLKSLGDVNLITLNVSIAQCSF
jgi:hypothetical protein